jgi:hypothetical protein
MTMPLSIPRGTRYHPILTYNAREDSVASSDAIAPQCLLCRDHIKFLKMLSQYAAFQTPSDL